MAERTPASGDALYPSFTGRIVDDTNDSKTGGTYSHNKKEWSATLAVEIMNEILKHQALIAADKILAPQLATITKESEGTPGANDIRFTIQVQDSEAASLSKQVLLDVWTATSDMSAPAGAHTLTVDTGTLIETVQANLHYRVLTNSSGLAKVIVNPGGGVFTRYVIAAIGASTKSLVGTWS